MRRHETDSLRGAVATALARRCGNPSATGAAAGQLKVGFITKFPVDFYDIMVDAVKKYDAEHAESRSSSARARAAPTTRARSPSSRT